MRAKISFSSLALALLASPAAFGCGTYELKGVVRFDTKTGYRIVVGEGSKSETVFSVPPLEIAKLAPYPDAPVRTTVEIREPFNGTRARIASVDSVELRAPDPLHPAQDSAYRLVKKSRCQAD